jgi:hypothetical protein
MSSARKALLETERIFARHPWPEVGTEGDKVALVTARTIHTFFIRYMASVDEVPWRSSAEHLMTSCRSDVSLVAAEGSKDL